MINATQFNTNSARITLQFISFLTVNAQMKSIYYNTPKTVCGKTTFRKLRNTCVAVVLAFRKVAAFHKWHALHQPASKRLSLQDKGKCQQTKKSAERGTWRRCVESYMLAR